MSKANDLIQNIIQAGENLITLQIVTVVGEPEPVKNDDGKVTDLEIAWDKQPKTILTKINMLQGDITTSLDPIYLSEEYAPLRQFHQEREKQGLQIVKDNIAAVKELLGLARLFRDEETKPESGNA